MVVTYVNGILTVVRDENRYVQKSDKPSFITAENFYYEPSLMQKDGIPLTDKDIKGAIKFINSFVFPKDEPQPDQQYCVNKLGKYMGVQFPDENNIAISVPEFIPIGDDQIYDFEKKTFYRAVKVNDEGVVVPITTEDFKCYLPISNSIFPTALQIYNFDDNKWLIDFVTAKQWLIDDLTARYRKRMMFVGKDWMLKVDSRDWYFQNKEAKSYTENTNAVTPFIDALLINRGLGETKEELVTKIISKNNEFLSKYGVLVGKSQIKVEAIDPILYRPNEINKIREWFKIELISIFKTPDFRIGTYFDIIREEIEALDQNSISSTPFIDGILVGREDNKNKNEYINECRVILDETKQKTAMLLAKYQTVLKLIQSTNTVEELETIKLESLCPSH